MILESARPFTFNKSYGVRATSSGEKPKLSGVDLAVVLVALHPVASDINPVAYCITKAKTNAPTAKAIRRRLTERGVLFTLRYDDGRIREWEWWD